MKKHRLFAFLSIVCLLLAALPVFARADMGPKPQITVRVINPPSEPYYLDLLIPVEENANYDNLTWSGIDSIDEPLSNNLREFTRDGWQLAMLDGTVAPMRGMLESQDDTFVFGYVGVPDEFRVAVAVKDGGSASLPIRRTMFQQVFTYDYAANSLATSSPAPHAVLKQLCLTLFPTLLIEGVLLIMFGFSFRRNWKIFVFTNLTTQLVLSFVLGTAVLRKGTLFAYTIMVPLEIVIFLFEADVFRKRLVSGRAHAHPVVYAFTANAASAVCTFLSVKPLFHLLMR